MPVGLAERYCSSGASDLAHGVMEGEAEDLDQEVNGVAGQIALGPAPVTVLDDQAGVGGQFKIARLLFNELQAACLQQRQGRCHGRQSYRKGCPGKPNCCR